MDIGGRTANPSARAGRAQVNSVDNVERVLIDSADPNTTYTVKVQGTTVPAGPQTFSLCIGDLVGSSLAAPLCYSKGAITMKQIAYDCGSTVHIEVVDCGLNISATLQDSIAINVKSTSNPSGVNVGLTETGNNTARFVGSIVPISSGLAECVGGPITATYVDADNGAGGLQRLGYGTAIFSGPTCCES